MSKYSAVKISGVIMSIGKNTDVKGYTKTILESFLPSDEELKLMNQKQQDKWASVNNKRMKAICKFLNENNL